MPMDPDYVIDYNGYLIEILSRKETIRLSVEKDPEVCLFYGPFWVPVWCYVMKLISNSEEEDAATLEKTMNLIIDLVKETIVIHVASQLPWSDLRFVGDEGEKKEQKLLRTFLQDFVPQVQKFFKVPTKISCHEEGSSSVSLNQNEVLAAFMDFILQIWNSEANRDDDVYFYWLNESYGLVYKGLKYLLTYLGDVPFQCCPTHQLKDLLKTILDQFENVANQAGHFTFCYILSPQLNNLTEFYAHLDDLLKVIEILDVNIKQYCITFSASVPTAVTTTTPRVTRPIDSLFIVDSLLADLESLINQRFKITIDVDSGIDMEDQIGALFEELKLSKIFLKDVELVSRETADDCFVAVRETAYEAEYIINSYVLGSIPVWYLRLRLPVVVQKLKLNQSRLQEIKSDCDVLQVTEHFTKNISLRPRETPIAVVEDYLVGIDETKINILEKLIKGSKSRQVISLVGMPGLGKTTLAKILFESSSVQSHFDRRAWCVISQTYEKKRVFVEILMTLKIKDDKKELLKLRYEQLSLMIHQSLMGNRYLIVVDDIWTSKAWDDIMRYFPDDKNGSRIILTSRIKDATPRESIFPTLQLLSEADSMKLFVKKVFLNEHCPPQLLAIGNKIAKRCNGLPLALVAIAGILKHLDQEERVWENIERDLCKFILDSQGDCMKVLEFSYEHLPNHLKICFLYLGKFPEDTKIPVRNVLRLWVAEGFIEEVKESRPEDVAREYLHDLINRSLVFMAEKDFDGSIKACRLHDLLRDLCLRKADEKNFMKSTKEPFSMYLRHHRLCVDCPQQLNHFGLHCRSFSGRLPDATQCFLQMPLHRVIDMFPENPFGQKDLEGIDMLVYLRYLCAPERELSPQSASNLVNLEFLDIAKLSGNEIALSTILKMVKLKHLKIGEETRVINDCDSSQTTNLQYLSGIKISNSLEDDKIFKCSPNLRNLKCIWNTSQFPDFGSLTKLEKLTMRSENIGFTMVVFPSSIKKLSLGSIGLPWDEMSIIGRLSNLQVLKLKSNAFVGEEWHTNDDEFQKLSFLKLDGVKDLKQWITYSEHFPELQSLVLKYCDNLQDISSDLGNISTLQTIEVQGCSYLVSKSAVHIEQKQHKDGNKELQVSINNEYWSKKKLLQEHTKLKDAYNLYTENHDLEATIRSLTGGHCPTESERQKIFHDSNGSIDDEADFLIDDVAEFLIDDEADFLDFIAKIKVPYSEPDLQKASRFFRDRVHWRYISISGLTNGLRELGQGLTGDEVLNYMRQAGIPMPDDCDRELEYDEFKKLMMIIDVPRPYDLRTGLSIANISEIESNQTNSAQIGLAEISDWLGRVKDDEGDYYDYYDDGDDVHDDAHDDDDADEDGDEHYYDDDDDAHEPVTHGGHVCFTCTISRASGDTQSLCTNANL